MKRSLLICLFAARCFAGPDLTDCLSFGVAESESAHALTAERSAVISGGLGQPARTLLAPPSEDWKGGTLSFTLKVDPEKPNYATVRFWGSDVTVNCLSLFCEGKQIGYRHLGDIEILEVGGGGPAYLGRFFYATTPLPLEMTRGKTELRFEIRSSGPMWAYGSTFDRYQKPMIENSRGLYRIYVHTDGFFVPPSDEIQGPAPVDPPTRKGPGFEVLQQTAQRVELEIRKLIASPQPLSQVQMQFLAKAYHANWTSAFKNQAVVSQELKSLDALYAAYRKNPRLAEADPATYNADWFGLGISGEVLSLLKNQLLPFMDGRISDGAGGQIDRRSAFTDMLSACRDWHRKHRRLYTNQTMINDLYGIYLANRGIAAIAPAKAMPEKDALRYLYESVGLEPWRDSDAGGSGASETGGRNWGVGENYWQLTAKGLTKELGYVGYYGEVLDWVTSIYEATRPSPSQPGDEAIRAQLIKIARARSYFRHPGIDAEGNRAMRIETVIGWRDGGHYPGDVAYGERTTWDASTLYSMASTLDSEEIGFAQQMMEDNQLFALLEERLKDRGFRVTAGLLGVPAQFALLKAQPPSPHRLPMSPGQPDFVFSDEEDGVVAIKHGDRILYASLYWRARNAVNFLARVHFMTPRIDRLATVRQHTEFEPSGLSFKRPDFVNFGFAGGGPKYPEIWHSAHAGETLPIAKIPEGVRFKAGDESVYAGKGSFYVLRYGDYLIGMNMSATKDYELSVPSDASSATELVTRRSGLKPGEKLSLKPRSTAVLYLGN